MAVACKQSAPHSRQITTPNSLSLNFYRPDALPDTMNNVKALKARHVCRVTKNYALFICFESKWEKTLSDVNNCTMQNFEDI